MTYESGLVARRFLIQASVSLLLLNLVLAASISSSSQESSQTAAAIAFSLFATDVAGCDSTSCVTFSLLSIVHLPIPDGRNATDENGKCPDCPIESFTCPLSVKCQPLDRLCDGYNHCEDGSYETEKACPCKEGEFRCQKIDDGKPGLCIPSEKICDIIGIWDCPLGDDEANCTVTARISKTSSKILGLKSMKLSQR